MTNFRRGSASLIRKLNEAIVINIIRNNSPISRTGIARLSALTYPTVSKTVDALLSRQLVVEFGRGESSGGRRPVLLGFNPQVWAFLGVRLSKNDVFFGGYNLAYELLVEKKLPLRSTKPQPVAETIASGVSEIVSLLEKNKQSVLGVGIGSPGRIGAAGTVISPFALRWREAVPLQSILEEKLGLPIFIDNDINVEALGEVSDRLIKSTSVVYISVSTGVGAAIILNGQVYQGAMGAAGELGHFGVDIEGELCECGNRGCLETYISTPAIARRLDYELSKGQDVFNRLKVEVQAGKPTAIQAYQDLKTYIAFTITNLVNLLNPSHIILGGDIVQLGPAFLSELGANIAESCGVLPFNPQTNLLFGNLGKRAGIYGAAVLVDKKILQSAEALEA